MVATFATMAAGVGAASGTPAPPAIFCTAAGVPVAGPVVLQGPIACAVSAFPGYHISWSSASPAGPAAGALPSPVTVVFTGGGDGAYGVIATQTDILDLIPPITSAPSGLAFTLDTLPPTVPSPAKPGDGGRLPSLTPELGWDASHDAGVGVAYYVVTVDGVVQAPVAGTRFRVSGALAQGPHAWQVVAVDGIGRASPPSAIRRFAVDTVTPAVASLAPADGATGAGAATEVQVGFSEPVKTGALRLCVTSCGAQRSVAARVTWSPAGVGLRPNAPLSAFTRYQVRLTDVRDLAGNTLPNLTTSFTTGDTAAPPGDVSGLGLTPGPARISLDFTPPPDPGLARIRVLRKAGGPPSGTSDPGAAAFDLAAGTRSYVDTGLEPGVRVFYALYAVDHAGRFSASAATGSAVPTVPAAAPDRAKAAAASSAARTARARRRARSPRLGQIYRARLLLPGAGSRLATLRPVLRWRGQPARTRMVNLQIFEQRPRGRDTRKVLSRFPTGVRFRVPAGVLKPGRTYVWRVWPWLGNRYSSRALAQSSFRVRASARSAGVRR